VDIALACRSQCDEALSDKLEDNIGLVYNSRDCFVVSGSQNCGSLRIKICKRRNLGHCALARISGTSTSVRAPKPPDLTLHFSSHESELFCSESPQSRVLTLRIAPGVADKVGLPNTHSS